MGINEWKAANFYHVYMKKKETRVRYKAMVHQNSYGRPVWPLDGDFRDVALCCSCSPGGDTYARHTCFQKFLLALQFIYSTFCHQEAHLTAI